MATTYPVAVHVKAKDSASEVIGRTARRIGRSLSGLRGQATSASAAMSSVGTSIREGTGRALLYGVGALGAGMVGAGIAAKSWAESALDVSGELVDFRAKTGFAIEALQEWRYAAGQSGVETATFNSAIMNLSKQLGPLRNGTGKLAKYTKDTLNPALLEQVKATESTEEALGLYVAALEEIEDPSKRAAAANVIFGRAGKDMTALAAAGAVEIKKLRDEKRADGVMSTDMAERNEALGDQVARLKGRYETFTTTIGTKFLEALAPHLDGLGQWFDRNKDVIGQNVGESVDWLAASMASIDWAAIASGATTVWEAIGKIGGVAAEAWANMQQLYQLGEELGGTASNTYEDLKSGILGLVGVDATSYDDSASTANAFGVAGNRNPFGSRTQVTTLEQKAAAVAQAQQMAALLGVSVSSAADVERETAAVQAARRRQFERASGMRNSTRSAPTSVFDRVRSAQSQQRTAAERLDGLPYGLGAVHASGPPAPLQEVVIKVESEPGTTATITKAPKAANVKVGTRRVGTGGN